MSDKTGIAWTSATWNPIAGCSLVSPGCTNCYAMREAHRLGGRLGQAKYAGLTEAHNGHPVWNGQVRLWEKALDQPLRWTRPRRIFVNSMSDLFHESLPDEAIEQVFAVMALAPQHTFQVLTKRPARALEFLADDCREDFVQAVADDLATERGLSQHDPRSESWPLPNVWLGVSVEDQQRADDRIPILLQTPAAVRWVSYEPALGPVRFAPWIGGSDTAADDLEPAEAYCVRCGCRWDEYEITHECPPGFGPRLDWIVVGGESGPRARPFGVAWARSTVAQCRRAGVPCFVKQLGARPVVPEDEDVDLWGGAVWMRNIPGCSSYEVHLAHRAGADSAEWPEDLRVQEWPA